MQGRSVRDIQLMFKDDPFIKVNQIVKAVDKIDKAKDSGEDLKIKKAVHEFYDGRIFQEDA